MGNRFICFSLILVFSSLLVGCNPEEKSYSVDFYATNDIHGSLFSEPYIEGENDIPSLSNVSYYINKKRADGENVVLMDIGDALQGDNATYYFNFVDTLSAEKHIFSRITEYIGYDALIVGNHDVETGHKVYDKINEEIDIPYLAANAINTESGKPYFKPFTILSKNGVKIAIIGMTNPNIPNWLSTQLWEGMIFKNMYPLADSIVRDVRKKERPDLVVLAIHGGVGTKKQYDSENPAQYIASKIQGVDIIFAAHDHRKFIEKVYNGKDSILVIEGGSKCRYLSKVEVSFKKKGRRIYDKQISGSIVNLTKIPSDTLYNQTFKSDFEKVKAFSNAPIGYLSKDIDFNDAFYGMSDYLNLIHLVQLSATDADISISAPLCTVGRIKKGILVYSNMLELYKYENQLYVINMSGKEIIKYLEASYKLWVEKKGPSFNYDSAAGIIYSVSKSAGDGSRVTIKSMADGSGFDENKIYKVAMTSYRASGAGGLLGAAGIQKEEMDSRIITKYKDIRSLIYDFTIKENGINLELISKIKKLGYWNFVK